MCLEKSGILEVVLRERRARNDLPAGRKDLPGGLGVEGNYTD